jgi:hypothetical protein
MRTVTAAAATMPAVMSSAALLPDQQVSRGAVVLFLDGLLGCQHGALRRSVARRDQTAF